jgi:hypothetical protein
MTYIEGMGWPELGSKPDTLLEAGEKKRPPNFRIFVVLARFAVIRRRHRVLGAAGQPGHPVDADGMAV